MSNNKEVLSSVDNERIMGSLIDLCDELRRRHIRREGVSPLANIQFIEKEILKTESEISDELVEKIQHMRPGLMNVETAALTVMYKVCVEVDNFKNKRDHEESIQNIKSFLKDKEYLKGI